ncbi:MAG: GDSL-type esterase/lipase family protein [Deferrisomatales bacterium]|nr:GDSL-type esterase/lipase family protein [Deferrisomatales bacterium]
MTFFQRPWVRRLAAATVGLAAILAVEGGLRLSGVAPLAGEDRFVGFEGTLPLFEPDPASGNSTTYRLAAAKQEFFNPQSFRMPKGEGVFRIVSFGGSTTYGHPYLDHTSFPRAVARLLGLCDPGRTYESVNAGGISYASYRVRRLMGELSAFDPDLYVVFSGHNEFLERRTFEGLLEEPPALRGVRRQLHSWRLYTLLYRLLTGVAGGRGKGRTTILGDRVMPVLEQVGGPELYHRDETFREGVILQYRRNLEAMVRDCREMGVPLVLCTLPSNLSGVRPFKSAHSPGLSRARLALWQEGFDEGERALGEGRYRDALVAFDRAAAIDEHFALLQFLRGRALEALGESAQAGAAYTRAKEEDIIPLRALDAFNAAVREVGRREGVPVADVEARFRELSPGGIPGANLFEDHVHPTLFGQILIAREIVATAVAAGLVPLAEDAWPQCREPAVLAMEAGLEQVPRRYRAMGQWVVGRTYLWAGRYDEARAALTKAWEVVHDIAEIPYFLARIELTRSNPREALALLSTARQLAPADPVWDLTPEISLATALGLVLAGEPAAALIELDDLRAGGGDGADALLLRAKALHALGREEEARRRLGEARQMARGISGFLPELARAYWSIGERAPARELYREYLERTGNPDPDGALWRWEGDQD